jgi:tRNA pseudouridine55 synthase
VEDALTMETLEALRPPRPEGETARPPRPPRQRRPEQRAGLEFYQVNSAAPDSDPTDSAS